MGVLVGLVYGVQTAIGAFTAQFMAQMQNAPQTVTTAKAATTPWQPSIQVVGTVTPVKGADLAIEGSGVVDQIYFESGADVKEGAPLVRLRDDQEVAHLQSLQAAANLAQITNDRNVKQLAVNAVSQSVVDASAANLRSARAALAEQQAVVAKKWVKAPFAGHLGVRMVNVGQYVNAGTPVVTLQVLDPIYIDFFVPQQNLDQVQAGQKVTATVDTYPDETFTGEVSAVNPKVDANTRNVQVRVTMANPDRKLLPGMYAQVNLQAGKPQNYVTLPQTAVTFNPYGNTVFIVHTKKDTDGKDIMVADQTFVTTGDTRGDQIVVLSGVNNGDMVVTSGQLKLQNGSKIAVNNEVTPASDANPKPQER